MSNLDKLNDAVRDGRLVISEAGKELAERMRNTPGKVERFVAVDPGFDDSESVAITMQRWADGTLVVEDVQRLSKHEPPSVDRVYYSKPHDPSKWPVENSMPLEKFQRIYQGTWEDGSPVYTNACGMPSQAPEPPPVGAKVSYEVALADMQRRPEARYQPLGGCAEYKVQDGEIRWRTERDDWDKNYVGKMLEELRWTRLPDATTLPAIGAEVSWSEAKRDMQARKEARYRPTCSPGHEYAWASQLVLRELGGLWQSADWSEDVEGQLRWARLA